MRTRSIVPRLLVAVLTFTACKSEPQLNGQSLLCSRDATCPDGFRCYQGGCIINSAPELVATATQVLALGDTLTLTAVASDAEGDALTFQWTQQDGPETLLATPLADATLLATPTMVGGFAFEIMANDGYVDSAPRTVYVNVIDVPVAGDVIYVSKLGDEEAGCGTLTRPCLTIVAGLAARATVTVPLLVANGEGTAYSECLNLTDEALVIGGFDEDTWAYDAASDDTEVSCTVSGGHLITAAATLRNLMLSSNVASPAALEQTLLITNASPMIEDVLIQSPSCAGCIAVAVHNNGGSPALTRSNVRAAPLVEFDYPDYFIGVLSRGGSPVITGERVGPDIVRGRLLLNAPTNYVAIGVLGLRSNVTLQDAYIAGGAAPHLYAAAFMEGAPVVDGSDVSLAGFNTRVMYGLAYKTCNAATWDCVCYDWPGGCPAALTALAMPNATATNTPTFDGNAVTLSGAAEQAGLLVCLGAGLYVQTDSDNITSNISGNSVTIGDNFTLAAAGIIGGSPTRPAGVTLASNVLTLGTGTTDGLCEQLNRRTIPEFPSGAVGLYLGNTLDATMQDNEIRVAGHDFFTVGFNLEKHESATVEGNRFDVGADAPTVEGVILVGATVVDSTNPDVGAESSFARNEIIVRRGAPLSVGLSVSGLAHSYIDNNFIFGGRTPYSVGLQLEPSTLEAAWPAVRHNTIHGGGDGADGLTSAAVRLIGQDPAVDGAQAASGLFENNLLDGGFAQGRRFVFDNIKDRSFVAAATGNIAQFDQDIPGPQPTTPMIGTKAEISGAIGNAVLTDFFYVVLPNTGEVAYVEPDAGVTYLTIPGSFQIGQRIVASWAGDDSTRYDRALLVATEDSVSVGRSSAGRGYLQSVDAYSTVTASGATVTPTQLVLADTEPDKNNESEIIILAEDGTGTKALWRMMPDGVGSYGAPAAWVPTVGGGATLVAAPLYIGRGLDPTNFILLDDAFQLHLWGVGASGATVSLDLATALGLSSPFPEVQQLFGTDFVDVAGATTRQDVVSIIGATLRVWRNLNAQGGLGSPVVVNGPACSGNAVSAAVGSLDAGTSNQAEMVVACANGDLEIYSYFTGTNELYVTAAGAYPTGSEVSGMAITSSSRILSADAAHNTVHLYDVTGSPLSISNDTALSLTPNVAQRHLGTWVESDTMSGVVASPAVELYAPADPPACGLALHANRATSYDLHLTGTTQADNACIDADMALTPPVTTDFDGETRDATPDAGADEVP
ncbi:MAG: hypothetical protein AAB426_06035 [Myxococcota bacterium]